MSFSINASVSSAPQHLSRGQALTFRPQQAGVLRVASGRVWATLRPSIHSPQPRWSPEDDAGDVFVMPGTDLPLRAGQSVVLESWPAVGADSSALVWEPAPVSALASHWQDAVAQPSRDLGQGLAQVVRALARLLRGLVAYSEFLVAGRGKVQTCLESNQP